MHLLVVTPDFPPLGSPQAYQSVRLVKALALAGCEVTVIAGMAVGARKEFHHASETYDGLPSAVVVRRFEGSNFPSSTLGRRAYRYFMPSDPNCQYWPLRQCLRWAAATLKIDGIISVAEPLVSHLAVQKTQFPYRVPFRCFWFSDPVPMSADAMKFKWRRSRCEAICRTALQTGNYIVGVTTEIVDPIMRLDPFSSAECMVLPHVYDSDDWPRPVGCAIDSVSTDKVIRITHTGALYWKRTPFSLIEGVRLLKRERQDLPIELILLGGIADETAARLAEIQAPCPIKLGGVKSYSESKAVISDADILCVIDVDLEHNIHLPSKVADYVGARKPILYIGLPNSPVVRALEGHPVFAQAHTPAEVAAALKYLINRRRYAGVEKYEIICNKFNLKTAYGILIDKIYKNHEHHY